MYKITIHAIFENKNENSEMLKAMCHHFGTTRCNVEDGLLTFRENNSTRFHRKHQAVHYAKLINQIASAWFKFPCDPAIISKRENGKWVIA